MRLVNRDNQEKLYLQLAGIIEACIARGDFAVGAQLPTEEEFCRQQGVSKAVVRAAMQELARKGYIRKIAGKGTFVQKPPSSGGVWLSLKLTENILDYGVAWDTEVVQKMSTLPPSDLREFFAMEDGAQVLKIIRVRSIGGTPVLLETAYVSQSICPGLAMEDLRASSLIEGIVETFGVPITRCADSVEATRLERREAELLNMKENDPALLLDRILYTSNDRVAAFVRALSVSTRHRITFESVRA